MPRDLPIGNGNLMINFDHEYNVRDVYYPHVGQDNQTSGDVIVEVASGSHTFHVQRTACPVQQLLIHLVERCSALE